MDLPFVRLLIMASALGLAACGFQLRGAYTLPYESLFIAAADYSVVGAGLKRFIRTTGSTHLAENAKEAQATFRNDAVWPQAWPLLLLSLSDADGRAIAARDFSANEYLGTAPTANGIAGGQVAGVAVDVVDPSPRVTAFTFEFR